MAEIRFAPVLRAGRCTSHICRHHVLRQADGPGDILPACVGSSAAVAVDRIAAAALAAAASIAATAPAFFTAPPSAAAGVASFPRAAASSVAAAGFAAAASSAAAGAAAGGLAAAAVATAAAWGRENCQDEFRHFQAHARSAKGSSNQQPYAIRSVTSIMS